VSSIRFIVDDHVPHAIVRELARRGVDIRIPADVGLRHAPDTDYLSFTLEYGFVLVTFDDDFLGLHSRGTPHAGIIFCPPGSQAIGYIVEGLLLIWEVYDAAEMVGHLEYL